MGSTTVDMLTNESVNSIQDIAYSTDDIVWLYNEKLFEANKPVVGYLVAMSILGLFGNGSAIYIYGCRFKRNTINFYILLLAIFDVISSLLLSMEALDRRFPMYSGNIGALCKTVRLTEFLMNAWAAGVLVCIAFDRYYKICHPMKSFTMSKAKKLLAVLMPVGCVCFWPTVLFHGPEMISTGIPGIYGKDCADDDNYKDLPIMPIYYIILMVLNIGVFVVLVIMYSLLYKEIWKWKHKKVGEDLNKMKFRSVRSISAYVDSGDKDRHIQFSETNVVFESKSISEQETDKVSGSNGSVTVNSCPNQNHNDMQECFSWETTSQHEQSFESCDSVFIRSQTEQNDTCQRCQQNCSSNASSQTPDSENISYSDGQDLHKRDYEILQNNLNTTFSSSDSDKINDVKIKQNGNTHLSLGASKTNGHVVHVTKISVNSQDSLSLTSAQSSPREQDHMNITKSTTASNDQPTIMLSKRNGSVISHFSSISSNFRKKFSRGSTNSLKHRSPKSSASLAHSTFLFAVITAAYIISYMPYFIVEILNATGLVDMNGEMSLTMKQMLRLANSSFSINMAINPIIYSILNPAFQTEVKIMFFGSKRTLKR